MPKSNFLFYLNSYNDLCQTSTPALNQFKWSREINGVPYNLSNSQEIQVLPSLTTPNVMPYSFATPATAVATVTNSTATVAITGSPANIAVGQLVVGTGIPVGTLVNSFAGTTTFTVTSANASVGATYTNNGQTFTVTSTVVAGTTLVTTQTGTPLTSGVLTLTSGTGDATIAFSAFATGTSITLSAAATSSGTPTLTFYQPASFLYLESDQQVSVIYNGGSPMAITPFEINGLTTPGVFFMNGPVYSLTITNMSVTTANVFFASMG